MCPRAPTAPPTIAAAATFYLHFPDPSQQAVYIAKASPERALRFPSLPVWWPDGSFSPAAPRRFATIENVDKQLRCRENVWSLSARLCMSA